MEFLNVGFTELLLIAIVVMVVFGPERTREGMRWAARQYTRFTKSATGRELRAWWEEMREMPYDLMREANLEQQKADLENREPVPAVDSEELQRSMLNEDAMARLGGKEGFRGSPVPTAFAGPPGTWVDRAEPGESKWALPDDAPKNDSLPDSAEKAED